MLAGSRGDRGDEDEVVGALLGAQPWDVPELAARASAVTQVSADAPPFLLIHGAADTMVPPEHSERLHHLLVEAGARSTYRSIAGAEHCFVGYVDVAGIIDESAAFFATHI
jgi:dipeptidyl aminopeptidase/acylaminoacyl peptidase